MYFGKHRTSAFIFNYDKLQDQDIDLQSYKAADNANSNATPDEVNLIDILHNIIVKWKPQETYNTENIRKQVQERANQIITPGEFKKLMNEANNSMKDLKITTNDDQINEIYVQSTTPF